MDGGRIGDWNIPEMVWARREGCGSSWVGDFGKSTSWGFACINGLWIGWGLVTVTTSRAIMATFCGVVEEA